MTSRLSRTFDPLDPSALLDLAAELSDGTTPEYLRSAGDRAYYAAFLSVRDQLTSKNYAWFRSDGSAHLQVRQGLTALNSDMGQLLHQLRVARNILTYDTGHVTLPRGRSLSWMLESSRRIIDFVDALPVL